VGPVGTDYFKLRALSWLFLVPGQFPLKPVQSDTCSKGSYMKGSLQAKRSSLPCIERQLPNEINFKLVGVGLSPKDMPRLRGG